MRRRQLSEFSGCLACRKACLVYIHTSKLCTLFNMKPNSACVDSGRWRFQRDPPVKDPLGCRRGGGGRILLCCLPHSFDRSFFRDGAPLVLLLAQTPPILGRYLYIPCLRPYHTKRVSVAARSKAKPTLMLSWQPMWEWQPETIASYINRLSLDRSLDEKAGRGGGGFVSWGRMMWFSLKTDVKNLEAMFWRRGDNFQEIRCPP